MEQFKHTQGPWLQMGSSVGVAHGEIASVWEIDGRSFSNARLIAAAPELLEALQELADLVEMYREGEYKMDSFTTQPAYAAIAKATGA